MFQEKDQKLYTRMGIKGICHIRLLDPDGSLKEDRIIHNTITELMDAHVADQMSDSGDAQIGFMNVGTGSGQGAADVGLSVELDRNALDSTTQGAAGDD